MTKRVRTCLFFLCAFSFLLAAPSILLYSQGYRLDLEQKRIVKTGGFYFKALPKGAQIFINGKLKKKTDFFFGSAFIENLLPREYLVEIKKLGYQSWEKNLKVEEARVTEAKNVVLVPEGLKLELLDKELEGFSPSLDEKTMVLKKEVSEDESKNWTLKLYDLEKGIKSHLVDASEISKEVSSFSNLIWSFDSTRIILEIEIQAEKKYFLLDLSKSEPLVKKLDFLTEIKNLDFHPADPGKLFFSRTQEGNLMFFEKDIEKGNESLVLKDVVAYKVTKDYIFWISEQGFLHKSGFALLQNGNGQKISFTPLELKKESAYLLEIINSKIFLKEDNALFLFNENSKKFEEIGKNIIPFRMSPDSRKLCFGNNFEIWILFLQEDRGQPRRKVESKLFLTRFSKEIEGLFWLDDHYLIFNVGSEIKIIEIDDRDKVQMWNLTSAENQKVYFNQKDKKLYILSEGSFFVSEKIR